MLPGASPKQLTILGAGSWGTALAIALASRFDLVNLWVRDRKRAVDVAQSRENGRYLPGFQLPLNVRVSARLDESVSGSGIVLVVVPSQFLRSVLAPVSDVISAEAMLVSATKGMEEGTFFRMSQVIGEVVGRDSPERTAVLSGPTFAREIAAGEPAAVVVASEHRAIAEAIQQAFATPALRLYTSSDVIGVEIGAALKNVIAIGAGVCSGLGLGSNSVAALVTRGLAEVTRLAVVMGGKPRTLSGLAGLGDLVLTATGDQSRNRQVGLKLGKGRHLPEILSEMTMVAEGIGTCRAAYRLANEERVDLPIVSKMYEVLYESKDPRQAIRELMDRPLTTE